MQRNQHEPCGEAPTAQPSPWELLDTPPPAQPGDESWTFINDLKEPLWRDGLGWHPRAARPGEADLSGGVRIEAHFPDPDGRLATAYDDFSAFLAAGGVSPTGAAIIETARAAMPVFEAYRIEVAPGVCRILANDTEGIRRGIFAVEAMMREAEGPFLPLGVRERRPFIRSRISRCFFGPIKRPPRYRDELMDDVDYYPDAYLNRLAHEGINGLWLTIALQDLCRTRLNPEAGATAGRRLDKLRRTVEQCRRYGIGTYLFAIEPRAWDAESPILKRHPEMGGARLDNQVTFCPWPEISQRYLYEATHDIFTQVPHLAGMINISHGERLTHCQSAVSAISNRRSPCPVCARRAPWEIIHRSLTPLARGMHDANPDATFIAWFYMPWAEPLSEWVYDLPRHCPEHVTLQFNFESGVTKQVLGRGRRGRDYWISTPGPSRRFERLATIAREAGASMSAKIQTGCSHEVATVPFVPVPGLLYRKFRAMRELGISEVMLCWYFGNYPGIMNQTAGELAFEPFPDTEAGFLEALARLEWGRHAATVARALRLFGEGYGHYPLVTEFQYWGPMHDGVVWPLLPVPRDTPLAPTWQIAWHTGERIGSPFAPSGDRIGEALAQDYTLGEAIEECRAMSALWGQGVALLRTVEADPALLPERRRDIGVARALGIQFRCGLNILRFYDLRERLANEGMVRQRGTIEEMRRIVKEEIAAGEELIGLCARDSRLGFHSEAEGYKYFPEKIRWRMDRLRDVLDRQFPAVERALAAGQDVFAAYTGRAPAGATVHAPYRETIGEERLASGEAFLDDLEWRPCAEPANGDTGGATFRWSVCHDRHALYVVYDGAAADDRIAVLLEPRRLWTCLTFWLSVAGAKCDADTGHSHEVQAREGRHGWQGWLRIPWVTIGADATAPGPLRINVRHLTAQGERAWIARHPWPYRLGIGVENPADLGWVFCDPRR